MYLREYVFHIFLLCVITLDPYNNPVCNLFLLIKWQRAIEGISSGSDGSQLCLMKGRPGKRSFVGWIVVGKYRAGETNSEASVVVPVGIERIERKTWEKTWSPGRIVRQSKGLESFKEDSETNIL